MNLSKSLSQLTQKNEHKGYSRGIWIAQGSLSEREIASILKISHMSVNRTM